MPELPEVETIKLGLQNRIVGLKLTKIQVISARSFIGNPNQVQGQKVLNIWRKAKILGIDLGKVTGNSGQVTVLIHLKMSGQLIYIPNDKRLTTNDKRFIGGHPTPDMAGNMPNKHTRVIFSFSDGSHLYFNDQRLFGWIKAMDNGQRAPEGAMDNFFEKLGPEPLDKEFTWEILKQNLLKHKSMPVKVAVMDQSVVSGVGNIYANEACFLAGINPQAKVITLTDEQFRALYRGVVGALRGGIKHGGSSRAHFVDAEGHRGYFLDYAFVYGRNAHKCKKCQSEIKKIQLGGRGTYLCPTCQR